tara:strand:- start:3133 stop:3975 length:843 start_codon:yes stop_codon:yes gene_type:complete
MNSLFVEHLTVIDCAYLDAARGLVGESWIVDVELLGDLDSQSMVLDFGEVKRRLKRDIDAGLDHTLLVPGRASELTQASYDGISEILFRSELGDIEHRGPECSVSTLPMLEITETQVADYLEQNLTQDMPPNVARLRIRLRTEDIDGPYYHYVHGLKKHQGQCQRIAHGHRSRLEIRVDGARDAALEQKIALAWTDIYLGTQEDEIARSNGRVRFAYNAPEGRFELQLPENQVDMLDSDTTVERIAEDLVRRVQRKRPGQAVEVRAYEGVRKGSVARSGP